MAAACAELAAAQSARAAALAALGRRDDAMAAQAAAVTVNEGIYGAAHPATRESRDALAAIESGRATR